MNFGNIKLPKPIYDCEISVIGDLEIHIIFFRKVDSIIANDLMSMEKDGVKIFNSVEKLGYFNITKNPYHNNELASAIAVHLEQQHNLKVLKSGF